MDEPKYYWVSYCINGKFYDNVTTVHPFSFQSEGIKNDMPVIILNFKEISKDEYDLFNQKYLGSASRQR